jgi:tetratricopeptide (TPR) repeat protein
MSAIETLATLFLEGRQVEMGPLFLAHVEEAGRTDVEIAYQIYLNLYERGNPVPGLQFLQSFCNCFPNANKLLLIFGKKLFAEQDKDIGANLLMAYIDADGMDLEAYGVCVTHCMEKGLHQHAIAIYGKFRERFEDGALSPNWLFNYGTAFMSVGDFAEALRLFKKCLELEPNFSHPRMNIRHLAMIEGYAPAIDYLQLDSNQIAGFTLARRRFSGSDVPVELCWTGAESEAIIDSLLTNGLCLIRGGCALERTQEILAHMQALVAGGTEFPIGYTPEIWANLEGLFRFDPAAIIQQIVGRPFRIDETLCVGRRVRPERSQSFVPFHQDSTAFSKALFNVWSPMTPAGGAYPSVQFVRKLITIAEQTKLFEGEYNLIEIDADFVRRKYGPLLYEVADAQPGDCVMFYGTTIHRSCNMERATETRFNIETRWSLG